MAIAPDVQPLAGTIKFWNIMIFADPGAGKTVFGGQDNKVLFIAPESDGLMSAQTMGSTAKHIVVKQWEDLKNAYEWYDEHREECDPYYVFVIDSISEMQYLAKDFVMRETAEEKIRKGHDHTKMQLADYGTMHEMVENMVRGFNDLPVNVLWTATAKKVADAEKNEFLVPDLQGKKEYGVSMKMAALMTSYGYMRTEIHDVPIEGETEGEGEDKKQKYRQVKRRVIYWEDTGKIRGKDRTNALKPFTVNMTLQQMREAIAGRRVRNSEGFIVKKDQPAKATAPKATAPKVENVGPQASPQPADKVSSEAKGEPTPENINNPDVPTNTSHQEPKGDTEVTLEAVEA